MGEAARRAVNGHSGADVLADLAGETPAAAPVDRGNAAPEETLPARAKPAAKARGTPAHEEEEPKHVRYVTASVQLLQQHVDALALAAVKRRLKRGGGRADSSAIVRELLDSWLEAGGE
jgi:hypothetical protein